MIEMIKKTTLGLAAVLLATSLAMPVYADSDDDGHDNDTEQSDNNSNDHDRDDNHDRDDDDRDDGKDHDDDKKHGSYGSRDGNNGNKYGINRNRFDKAYVTGNRATTGTNAAAINNAITGNTQ